MKWVAMLAVLATLVVFGLAGLRWSDSRAETVLWTRLLEMSAGEAPAGFGVFDPVMVADLPEPARRMLTAMIAPGTRLYPVTIIEMDGEFSLGTWEEPEYVPMRARQIIAPPYGFVWRYEGGGSLPIVGSDAATETSSWSRFWLAGLVPVEREQGTTDHARSAFGRLVAEAAIWAPASLLPGPDVMWEEVDNDTARFTIARGDLIQSVEITVGEDGLPKSLVMPLWSNINSEGAFRLQPFGADVSEFEAFNGYLLPTRVDAGNLYGTPEYFPHYRARVTDIRFPGSQ
ncbi:MAG: DUF6544 family protein [Pseudomonadota bacterium]